MPRPVLLARVELGSDDDPVELVEGKNGASLLGSPPVDLAPPPPGPQPLPLEEEFTWDSAGTLARGRGCRGWRLSFRVGLNDCLRTWVEQGRSGEGATGARLSNRERGRRSCHGGEVE